MLIPDPAYPAYAAMARAWGLEVRSYTVDPAQGFAQRADAIRFAASIWFTWSRSISINAS